MADTTGTFSSTPLQLRGIVNRHTSRKSDDITSVQRASIKDRSFSASGQAPPRDLLKSVPYSGTPSGFSTDLRTAASTGGLGIQNDTPDSYPGGPGGSGLDSDPTTTSEQRQAVVREKIAKEMKIKLGTENMLEALLAKSSKQTREQRQKVEIELGTSNRKLAELKQELDQELQRAQSPSTPPSKRMSSYFRGSPLRSPTIAEAEAKEENESSETESPSIVLTETLQELESEGMQPEYYIDRANKLVDLFRRHPTLKYDLAWSVFSLRIQVMLLSESTEVVAAGYRLTRHAIADRSSLQTIRKLHTDELVVLSLVKRRTAVLEREQAVKFVRAFLDVKDGAFELSKAVARSLVAVAEQTDDRLKDICLLTLAEILTKNPALLVSADGLSTLTDALAEGSFPAPEALVAGLLHVLDTPSQRQFLSSGREFEAMFAPFTDPLTLSGNEERLKTCAKAISAMMKTWPGFLILSSRNAASIRSLVDCLVYPVKESRDVVLEMLFDILRIKQPTWSSTYLAGRRLTTYGRMTTTNQEPFAKPSSADNEADSRPDLIYHFSAVVLATLLDVGLVPALSDLIRDEQDEGLKRKATLLLTEVLKLAYHSLPTRISAQTQVLGDLILPLTKYDTDLYSTNMTVVWQIASLNKTLTRHSAGPVGKILIHDELAVGPQADYRNRYSAAMDSEQFRQALIETGVSQHHKFIKWKWDLIHSLIEGPITNPKRLEDAMKTTKFIKRLIGFYQPFKYRFSQVRNTRPNQRYVRAGYALVRSLLQSNVGVQVLAESKLLRQIAECLAQVDRLSGLTSSSPMFDRHVMAETLSGGYFTILGALSSTTEGIQLMERWHMMNMFYHILELKDRDDLVQALLGNMDYSLDTHLRVLLSQACTSASTSTRLFATKVLRRYAVGRVQYSSGMQEATSSHWALRLVLTQLYDPSVEVCGIAVKILEEACDQPSHLEYVVKCRPSLDHLGEMGAPLLLRFLSTSVGYRYLSGLDYITQEMDDWFLGRNDAYVNLVEASLSRACIEQTNLRGVVVEDLADFNDHGLLPPHFYHELARTEEGCKLLRQSGHFYEFASIVRDFRLEEEDYETLLKVKGCLWAIGNVGIMELGAPFLEENDVVRAAIRIAEGAQVLSMRGTATYVLGLLSKSSHGQQMLAELGWDTCSDSHAQSLGVCIPRQLASLNLHDFKVAESESGVSPEDVSRYKAATLDDDPIKAKVLKLVVDMGNSVMYKKAASELHALKSKHYATFRSRELFHKTLTVLESHHYRMQARQFILDLFDKEVLRHTVLEDDTDAETNSSDTG